MGFISFILEKSKAIGLLVILVAIGHVMLGKSRWQYYPIYLVCILYFALVLLNYFNLLELNNIMSKFIIASGILLILVSIVFLLVLPKSEVPKPSGKFPIGTRVYELEDKARDEEYSQDKGAKRKIKYQIWYPADTTDGFKRAKWISDGLIVTRQLAKNMGLPFFMLDHTAKIYSNSYIGAPINPALNNYPVVLISHGWKGFRELHTDYAEELASNGFIAISIDHSHGSQAVKFKDGTVIYLNNEALPDNVSSKEYDKNSNLLVKTYGNDVGSVLEDLEKLNNIDGDFKGKLNLNGVGLLGHSTGGGGHVYISQKDKRIKAILGLDPWVNPIEVEKLKLGLSIPTLFLRSEQWAIGPNNTALKHLMDKSEDITLIQMNGTNHVDFTMTYMYSPITKYVGFTGKLGGRYSSEIQKEFILSFFNENLRNIDKSNKNYLSDIVDKYEHLEFADPLP